MCSCCVRRGLPAGIYETYNSNTCQFLADNCKANIIVVEYEHKFQFGACIGIVSRGNHMPSALRIGEQSARWFCVSRKGGTGGAG